MDLFCLMIFYVRIVSWDSLPVVLRNMFFLFQAPYANLSWTIKMGQRTEIGARLIPISQSQLDFFVWLGCGLVFWHFFLLLLPGVTTQLKTSLNEIYGSSSPRWPGTDYEVYAKC